MKSSFQESTNQSPENTDRSEKLLAFQWSKVLSLS